MRKLALIAAVLLLPAAAMGLDIINTSFEEFALGDATGTDNLGNTWDSYPVAGNIPQVINDPTASGKGKVVALNAQASDAYNSGESPASSLLHCVRLGVPPDFIYTAGKTVCTTEVYVYSNAGDFTNFGELEVGPNNKHYLDGGLIDPGDDVHAWTGGMQWDPTDPGFESQNLGPLPVDQWFTCTMVYNTSTSTVDLYVNGVLEGLGLPAYWEGSNDVFYRYSCLDPAFAGVNGMLINDVHYEYIPEPSLLLLGGVGLLVLLRSKNPCQQSKEHSSLCGD